MAVGLKAPGEIHPVSGARLSAMHCGIKANPSVKDLALIAIDPGAVVAGVFTQSHFSAAPVQVCRKHLDQDRHSRFLLINSGNANAATGDEGLRAALECCRELADLGGAETRQVLPFSTGVIAEALPVRPILEALPELVENLAADGWPAAALGIMTTDTQPKAVSRRVEIDGVSVTISGIAKGSGMIRPNMATMLAFVATDAVIAPGSIDGWLADLVAGSFNSITIDGDTSTNDSCMLIATGASGVLVEPGNGDFAEALESVFVELAQALVRDAEGATKFIEISVQGADNDTDARSIAFTIAESPLVKTALFASDPNWGRFIMAIGRSPVSRIDTALVDLYLGDIRLLHRGLPDPNYREAQGQAVMAEEEIRLRVDLNLADGGARIWTSDLSYDYVKINAEYRS